MKSKPKIIVTGKNGQLGSELLLIAMSYPDYEFIFLDRAALDLATMTEQQLEDIFRQHQPRYFINAAAYTAVDKAQSEQALAMQINGLAVGEIAKYCKKYSTQLIHISTDYVFDGNGTSPYLPADNTDPVNYYGATKLKGEQLALKEAPETIIIRTAWVYSAYGKNFVKTMLRLMDEKPSIGVVSDQMGAPTYCRDLAVAIMEIIEKGASHSGIYHYSNEGKITWYDFAVAIRDLSGLNCEVRAIKSSEFVTPAKRPTYSVLDTSSLKTDYNIQIRDWKLALKECLGYLERI